MHLNILAVLVNEALSAYCSRPASYRIKNKHPRADVLGCRVDLPVAHDAACFKLLVYGASSFRVCGLKLLGYGAF